MGNVRARDVEEAEKIALDRLPFLDAYPGDPRELCVTVRQLAASIPHGHEHQHVSPDLLVLKCKVSPMKSET